MIESNVITGTQLNLSLMTSLGPFDTRIQKMTLLRTIIGIDIARTVHDSGEGSHKVAVGIGVTSQEAFTLGSIPEPGQDTDFPTRGWVWRAQYRVFGFAADQPAVFTQRVDLDIRAQRKLDNGESFLCASAALVDGAAATNTIVGCIRQLWLVT